MVDTQVEIYTVKNDRKATPTVPLFLFNGLTSILDFIYAKNGLKNDLISGKSVKLILKSD